MADHYAAFRSELDAVLGATGQLLGDLVEAPRGDGTENENALIDNHLQQFFKAYYELKSRHDDTALSVAVLALTKSGKSTLLNALLGAECLPVNNVPETARICKIVHTPCNDDEQPRMQEGDLEHVGEAAIRQRLQEINSEVRAREHQPTDEKILHIYAPLAALEALPIASDSHTKIYLLDTPGPNEAGEEALRFQVERLLDSVDAVIYLLDYTKLKTAEEAAILQRLKGANPLLVRRLSRRLFFAVNKVDQVAQSEGLDEDETREYVAHLITRQLACDEFQLMPEQVLLVSARDALLSRLMLTGRASEASQGLFLRNAFGRRGATKARPLEEVLEAAAEMLQGSGLLELEERVLRFLYAQGGGVKLLATADDIARLLTEVENVAVATEGALRGGVEGLAAKAEGLRGDLEAVLQRLDEVLEQTASLHAQITDEIRTHLEALRTRLFRHIMEALDCAPNPADPPSTSSAPPTTPTSAAAAAAAAAISRAATPATGHAAAAGSHVGSGRWALVRQRFASLFGSMAGSSGSASGSSTPGGSASSTAGGTAGLRTKNKEELMTALAQLHTDVIHQINSEVRDFWGGLEAVCNARNASLVAVVNGHLAELVARVEAAVEQRLEVRLQAVALRLPQPTSEQFHSDLQDLISRGVEERQERHVRVGQREFLEKRQLRVKGHGLCSFGSYWVTAPVTKTFVETYTSTVYQLQPSEVLRHFIELVDSAVDSSEQVLSSYVHRYLHAQLDEARAQIKEYGERYISVVTAALDASYDDSEAREAALAHVQGRLEGARVLSGRVSAMQRALVEFVPAAISCCGYEEVQYIDYLSGSEYDTAPTPSQTPPPAGADAPPAEPLPLDPTPRETPSAHVPASVAVPAPTPFAQVQNISVPASLPLPPAVDTPADTPTPAADPTPTTSPTLPPTPFSSNDTVEPPASNAAQFADPTADPPAQPPSPQSPNTPTSVLAPLPDVPTAQAPQVLSMAWLMDPPADRPADLSDCSRTPGSYLASSVASLSDPSADTPADPPAESLSPRSSLASSLYSARSTSPDPFRLSISDIAGASTLPPSPPPAPTSPHPTTPPLAAAPLLSHPTPDFDSPSSRSPSPDIPEMDDLPSPSPPCSPAAAAAASAASFSPPSSDITPRATSPTVLPPLHFIDDVHPLPSATPRATSPTVPPPIHFIDDVHPQPSAAPRATSPFVPPPIHFIDDVHPQPSAVPRATSPFVTPPISFLDDVHPQPSASNAVAPTLAGGPPGSASAPPPDALQMLPLRPLPPTTPFPPPAANDSYLLPHTPPLSPTTVTNVASALHNYDEMMRMPPPPAPPAPPTLNPTEDLATTLDPTPRAPTPPPTAPLDIPISSTARDSVTTANSSRPPSLPTSPVLRPLAPLGTTPATPTLTPAPSLASAATTTSTAGSSQGVVAGGLRQAGAPAGPVDEVDVSDYDTICVKKDEIPAPPFDYKRGFAEVMSSGGLASSPEDDLVVTPRAATDDSEDWTLIEGSGSGF